MLLLEHDAPATLAAALALVDSCATDASSTGSSSSGGDSPPPARRVRKPNTAVLAELRAQVATLSERLLELQERRAGLPSFRAADDASASARSRHVAAKGSAQELEVAMRELRRLQEAKKRNAALKVAWMTQSTLARELRTIMIKQVAISVRSKCDVVMCLRWWAEARSVWVNERMEWCVYSSCSRVRTHCWSPLGRRRRRLSRGTTTRRPS